jgi:hypothetical protein
MILLTLTIIGCVWTAFTVFLRAEMLRKSLDPHPESPRPTYNGNWPIIIGMDGAALAFTLYAFELVITRQPPALGPASIVAASTFASTVILISMIGHNWREAVRRRAALQDAEDAAKVDAAVAAIPPTIEAAIPQVFRDLAAQPDPYQPGAGKPGSPAA